MLCMSTLHCVALNVVGSACGWRLKALHCFMLVHAIVVQRALLCYVLLCFGLAPLH
jgi:hypothetical protein